MMRSIVIAIKDVFQSPILVLALLFPLVIAMLYYIFASDLSK